MSNPKEKAKELIRKFYSIGANECEQCAIIAVDEIIKETDSYYDTLIASERKLYWEQVKTETENL